jgi:predicted phosphodiesterase
MGKSRKYTIGAQIVRDALKRFPDTPILALARKLYKENPTSFPNLWAVRNSLSYHAGLKSGSGTFRVSDKSLVREKTNGHNPFDLPDSHAEAFTSYEIKQSRTLILSDLHFPYQDNKAIESALNYGINKNVNCILINGDLIDFAGISRFEKDWRQRTVFEEFEAARKFLSILRKHFPKAKIVLKEGNHDERWEKWLFIKAPELFDDPEFKLEVRLRLGELKIDIVKDKSPVQIGKLTVLHGHELHGMGGVNPARATFLKTLDSALVGHYHRTSSHVETSMHGNVISVASTGCLCGLHPMFSRINKWNLGFAYCELDIRTGEYELENLKIIKDKVYK